MKGLAAAFGLLAVLSASHLAGQGSTPPTLRAVQPAFGTQGATITVTLNGDGFVPGNTQMFFSDDGITVLNVDVVSATSATAKLVLSGTVGAKQTLLRTPAGLSQPLGFVINPNSLSATDHRTALFAGTDSGLGFRDGIGQNARFQEPRGMWSDGTNLYVVDGANFTIRKMRLDTGEVTTLAGKAGEAAVVDGFGSAARFNFPQSIWGDGTFLYVTELRRVRRIRIADAQVTTLAGPAAEVTGEVRDGIGEQAAFQYLRGIWGNSTHLFVTDITAIRSINLTTREVRTIAGGRFDQGRVDGIGTAARFIDVSTVWGDSANLYLGDRDFIRKLNLATNEVTTFAPAQQPDGIWGAGGKLYVLDILEERLKEIDLSTGATRDLLAVFPKPKGSINPRPIHGIWADDSGTVYFADPYDHVVHKLNVTTGQVANVAGKVLESTFRDGMLLEARFSGPAGIWGDGENLYIADSGNHVIRKIDLAARTVTTIAGDPNSSGADDGIGRNARFHSPRGIWGTATDLYVTDPGNDTVRRVSLRTAEVTTIGTVEQPSGIAGNIEKVFYIDGLGNIRSYDRASEQTATTHRLCFPVFIRFNISTYCSGGVSANPVSFTVAMGELRQVSLTTGTMIGNKTEIAFFGASDSVGLWGDGSVFYRGKRSTVLRQSFDGARPLNFVDGPPPFVQIEGIWGDGNTLYVTDRINNAIHTITSAGTPTDRTIFVTHNDLEVMESLGSGSLESGRARYATQSGLLPFATATISYSENGARVSATTVKASKAITSGRIPIRQSGTARSGLSIANPNALPAVINFYYTDASGQDFGLGSFTIGSDQQILRFADETPFAVSASPFGGRLDLQSARTLTFTSSQPVVVGALWSQLNDRGQFLMAAVPVVELPSSGSRDLYLSSIQHGSGWTSEVLLLNATDTVLSGTISFFSDVSDPTTASAPMTVRIRGTASATFRYTVPSRSLERLTLDAIEGPSLSGFATLSADSGAVPHASVRGALRSASGGLVHETIFEAAHPSRSNALYAESVGVAGEIPDTFEDTTLLMINTSLSENLQIEARFWQGVASFDRLNRIRIPPRSQRRISLKDLLQGRESIYAGLLRLTMKFPELVVHAFRTSKNERGDLLTFAVPVFDDALPQSAPGLTLPLFVNGGGYSTRLTFFAPSDLSGTGEVRLINSAGSALSLPMR